MVSAESDLGALPLGTASSSKLLCEVLRESRAYMPAQERRTELTKLVDLKHPWSVNSWPFIDAPTPTVTDYWRIPRNGVWMRIYNTSMQARDGKVPPQRTGLG